MPEPGLPESFNVLMHELKGLGLDWRRIKKVFLLSVEIRFIASLHI
jgi:hypothetical protein